MSLAEPVSAQVTGDDGEARIDHVEVLAYELPTDGPGGTETDGTIEWSSTTMVVCLVSAGGTTGLGYSYGPKACAALIEDELAGSLLGEDATAVRRRWQAMTASIRNAGRPGVGMMAVSAVDTALWDLKARLYGLALVDLARPRAGRRPRLRVGRILQLPARAPRGPARRLGRGRDPAREAEGVKASRRRPRAPRRRARGDR